jgi:hypothetical protein
MPDNPHLAGRLQSAADALARVMSADTNETWIGIVKPDNGDSGAALLRHRPAKTVQQGGTDAA